MSAELEYQAENLINKIKHYLITTMGVTIDEASALEFHRAFCLTLREEIMINWTATKHTFKYQNPRTIYYLCMEYMPGRLLDNNITNIGAQSLIQNVLQKLGKNFDHLMNAEVDPGLGNGGLGRLAACFLDSLATMQMPAVAYGLRYQYGVFEQEIWDGQQVERPDMWLLNGFPWEFRRDIHAMSIQYAGRIVAKRNARGVETHDLVDYEEVRALAYDFPIIGYKEDNDFSVITLRLWSTKESPRNFSLQRYNAGMLDQAAENTCLTDVLYPNDNYEVGKRMRLKQEFLLVSASLQDIIKIHLNRNKDMSNFADKVRIQINDTHPALVIAELMNQLLTHFDFAWEEAFEVVKTCCSFTNHTILKEALEEWNPMRIHYLLPRQMSIIERLNLMMCEEIRKIYPGDEEKVRRMSMIENGQVKMAHMVLYGSHKVNGVAKIHSDIIKNEMFRDFSQLYPEKFTNVTNGVTPRRWLLTANKELSQFITARIGHGWETDFIKIAQLAQFAKDSASQEQFLEIKKQRKRRLLDYIREHNPIRDERGASIDHYHLLAEDALFDVQIKRLHEYKRQLMNALHTIMLYHEIQENPAARKVPRMIFIGGKAAPGYEMAKAIIQLILALSRKLCNEARTKDLLSLVFIENYNVSAAEVIIPAADLSQQISTAGMEASGTGNMKLTMNGALTLGTEDGANVEMRQAVTDEYWPFTFGGSAEENARLRQTNTYSPWDVYMKYPAIKKAVDALKDYSIAQTEQEHAAFQAIYRALMENDRYFILRDLPEYYAMQRKVEELFMDKKLWAEYALRNISAMGPFSSDYSICRYAKEIWEIEKTPVDKKELTRVRAEYSEHDKCRILSHSNPLS